MQQFASSGYLKVGELQSDGGQQDGVGWSDGYFPSFLLQLRIVSQARHVARPSAAGWDDRASEQPGHNVVPVSIPMSGRHIVR